MACNDTDNIDNHEIAKFNKFAADWWDKNGSMKSLHAINPLRITWLSQFINFKNQNILDIGCGGGILAESLAQLGANVTAIDVAAEVIKVAQEHCIKQKLTIDYQNTNIQQFIADNNNKKFDVILCLEMLEHVDDPADIIKNCRHLMHQNSQLFISTINRNLKSFLQAIIGAEYLLKLLARGTHEYHKFIKPTELANWAEIYNLKITHLKGINYNLLTKQFFLTNNIQVNYLARLLIN